MHTLQIKNYIRSLAKNKCVWNIYVVDLPFNVVFRSHKSVFEDNLYEQKPDQYYTNDNETTIIGT